MPYNPETGTLDYAAAEGFEPDEDGLTLVQGLGAQAIGGLQARGQADQPPEPAPDVEFKGDGTINVKNVGPQVAQRLQELISLGTQTKDFLGQAIQQALRKKEVLEKNPLIAQIGRTLSGVAANYAQPGSRATPILRGIGAFGADFFSDTPESLIARAAGLQAQKFGVERQIVGELQQQEQAALQQSRLDAQLNQQQRSNIIRIRGQYLDRAKNELITPEQATQIEEDYVNEGGEAVRSEARNFARSMVAASKQANFLRLAEDAAKTEAEAAKIKAQREAMDARFDQQWRLFGAAEAGREARFNKAMAGGLPPAVARRVDPIARAFDTLPIVKNVQKQAEAAEFAKGLKPTTKNPADDQALIYAFAKVMDPDSAVREGEYATVQKYAQSWAERFGFNAKRVFSNTAFLTPAARQNMKNTILARYSAGRKQYENVRSEYGRRINLVSGLKDGAEYLTDYSAGFPEPTQPTRQPQPPSTPLPDNILRQIPKNGTPVAVEINGVERIFRFVHGVVVEVPGR